MTDRQAVRAMEAADAAQRPANDEVVFIDGVGASRCNIESCRDGVQWIRIEDRVYWPLSDADARRLQSACCGNGTFDGPTSSAGDGTLWRLCDNEAGTDHWVRLPAIPGR